MRLLRHLARFQQAYRELDRLAARESWTRSEIEAWQLERLNSVWQHVVEHTPHYADLQAELGLPGRFSSLHEFRRRMPVLTKSEVADHPSRFVSRRAQRGEWYRTSGSTGTPLAVFHDSKAHREMLRGRYRFYAMWGHDIFDRMAWLWSAHDSSAPGLAGRVRRASQPLVDRLRNRLRLPAQRLGRADLRGYLRQIERFRPSAIYGLSRAIGLLAHEAQEDGFSCPPLKFVSLTGETVPPSLADAVRRAFRVPALVEYGSIEAPCIANQWPDGSLRVREDLVLVEAVPRAEGVFELLLTLLTNSSFALLRYAIGDLTDAPITFPERGFAVLANVAGRSDDLLRARTGRYVHANAIDGVLEVELAIRRYQVHQAASGSVHVALEVRETSLGVEATERLREKLGQLLDGYEVTVQRVERIAQTPAGKHRLITSELRPLD